MRLYIIIYLQILSASSTLGSDTIRIKALMDSAQIYADSELDKSLSFLGSAALLSLNLKNYSKYIECNRRITFTSLSKGNVEVYVNKLKIFENSLNQYSDYLGSNLEQYKLDLLKAKIYLSGMIGDFKQSSFLLKKQYDFQSKIFPDKQNLIFYNLLKGVLKCN